MPFLAGSKFRMFCIFLPDWKCSEVDKQKFFFVFRFVCLYPSWGHTGGWSRKQLNCHWHNMKIVLGMGSVPGNLNDCNKGCQKEQGFHQSMARNKCSHCHTLVFKLVPFLFCQRRSYFVMHSYKIELAGKGRGIEFFEPCLLHSLDHKEWKHDKIQIVLSGPPATSGWTSLYLSWIALVSMPCTLLPIVVVSGCCFPLSIFCICTLFLYSSRSSISSYNLF